MNDNFRLERRVPMAVIVTLVAQTGAGLMWAGAAEQRLGDVERRIEGQTGAPERLARVEEQTLAMRAQLQRIEEKLDRAGERGR